MPREQNGGGVSLDGSRWRDRTPWPKSMLRPRLAGFTDGHIPIQLLLLVFTLGGEAAGPACTGRPFSFLSTMQAY